MKQNFAVLFTSLLFTSIAHSQSLNELKEKYRDVSPLTYERMNPQQVVNAEATDKTEAEEQLAELKAQELEAQKAQEVRIYLDTDYQFFQALNITLDEDELDKAYQAKLAAENLEKLKTTDTTVKSEIGTSAPGLLSKKEGQVLDEKRTQILKKIAANGLQVRACILKFKKDTEFKGTAMTLAWEIEPSGKVANSQMKATDVENKDIKDCVLKSLAEWNFGEAMKEQTKSSHIEYTYRFVNAAKEARNTGL